MHQFITFRLQLPPTTEQGTDASVYYLPSVTSTYHISAGTAHVKACGATSLPTPRGRATSDGVEENSLKASTSSWLFGPMRTERRLSDMRGWATTGGADRLAVGRTAHTNVKWMGGRSAPYGGWSGRMTRQPYRRVDDDVMCSAGMKGYVDREELISELITGQRA
eukprot:GHVS01061454.1.p1 GENE.GHVS01061454.1~~GHVS01061454.1.p1  ORF type:complete len:165 (+),score=16.60 GHVS01061454.1:957-1451(+)